MCNMRVRFLKATYGDSFFIRIPLEEGTFTILVDGGPKSAFKTRHRGRLIAGVLKAELEAMRKRGEHIDLLIITHVDDDHIGGILEWFKEEVPSPDFVREIWMNDDAEIILTDNLNNTAAQAASLKNLIMTNGMKVTNQMVAGTKKSFDWGTITILAPAKDVHNAIAKKIGKELNNAVNDRYEKDFKTLLSEEWQMGSVSLENEASIAFLLQTTEGETGLFLGDADIDVVMKSLSSICDETHPLNCDWVKLSHHGSKNNFRPEFLDVVKARNYVVMTNGDYYGHPDKEVIAYVVDRTDANVLFNYVERGREMITAQDKLDYPNIMDRIRSTDE